MKAVPSDVRMFLKGKPESSALTCYLYLNVTTIKYVFHPNRHPATEVQIHLAMISCNP